MQGRATLSKRQIIVLIVAGFLAVGSLVAAPEDSVSQMFARMSGKIEGAKNLKISRAKPFPDITFEDAQGQEHSIRSLQGKPVLVNFWALWCASCKVEKPKLDTLQADYPGLVVLSLSDANDDLQVVEQYFALHRVKHLTPAKDPQGTAFRTLELRGLPTSIILDKTGNEIARAEGSVDWDAPAVRQFLERLMKDE